MSNVLVFKIINAGDAYFTWKAADVQAARSAGYVVEEVGPMTDEDYSNIPASMEAKDFLETLHTSIGAV